MQDVMLILDSLVELRRFAESHDKRSLLPQVVHAENLALAEVCADYCNAGSDDFHAVMMEVFPEIYTAHAGST